MSEIYSSFYNKNWTKAKQQILEQLKLASSNGELISMMGDISLQEKNYHLAIEYYEQAKKELTSNYYENYQIAKAYIQLKKGNQAFDFFNRSYQENPSLKFTLFQLGYVSLFFLRNKQQTINYWSKFVKKAPNDVQCPKIKKILELLKNSDFKIPDENSTISIEEALLLGGKEFVSDTANIREYKEGDEKSKNNNKKKGLLVDEEI